MTVIPIAHTADLVGFVWNSAGEVRVQATGVFEAYNPANVATYEHAVTDTGDGVLFNPPGGMPEDIYLYEVRDSAASYGRRAWGEWDWDGTALATVGTRAKPGDEMDLVDAPNATAVAAIQNGLSTFDAGADTVTVGTNNDKTGYSLTQAFPANFASMVITAGGVVRADDRDGAAIAKKATLDVVDSKVDTIDILVGGLVTWVTEIRTTTGGTFDRQTMSLEAIRARGDAAWTTATGFSTFDASTDTVDVGAIAGTAVTGPDDLKATGFSTHSANDAGSAAATAILVTPANKLGTDGSGRVTVDDKTGYKLAADGLDQIAADVPNGVASTFRGRLMELWASLGGPTSQARQAGQNDRRVPG